MRQNNKKHKLTWLYGLLLAGMLLLLLWGRYCGFERECRNHLQAIELALAAAPAGETVSIALDARYADRLLVLPPYCILSNLSLPWHVRKMARYWTSYDEGTVLLWVTWPGMFYHHWWRRSNAKLTKSGAPGEFPVRDGRINVQLVK